MVIQDLRQQRRLVVSGVGLGLVLFLGPAVQAQSDGSLDRDLLIEQRLREAENRMMGVTEETPAPASNNVPVVMKEDVPSVMDEEVPVMDEEMPAMDEPVVEEADPRQEARRRKVEQAQARREAKMMIRQARQMQRDAAAAQRAGLQTDARDRVEALETFVTQADFPEASRSAFLKAADALRVKLDAMVPPAVASAEDITEDNTTAAVGNAGNFSGTVPQSRGREETRAFYRQLQKSARQDTRGQADSPWTQKARKSQTKAADDLRRQREEIIRQQAEATKKIDQGVAELYQRAEAYYAKEEWDQARVILEDIELLRPDYKKTRTYLEDMDRRRKLPAASAESE